jgi:PAS domain S-box-containing protein
MHNRVSASGLGPIGSWEVIADTGELIWSDEIYQIHGMEVGSEIVVEEAIEIYHPDDRELVSEYVRRALEEKEDYQFDLRIVRADGEIRNVRSTGVVRVNDHGDVHSVFGVFQDITEVIRKERELVEKTQMLEQAERLASIGHWVVYADTGELVWSEEIYRIHGMEISSEVDVEEAILVYHPDDREKVAEYVRRALEEKLDYQFELRIVRPGGEVRNVLSTGVVRLKPDGNVHSVFGVFQDVTESRVSERATLAAVKEAEYASRSKSEFLANMSHELRTPLNAILGFSQALEKGIGGEINDTHKDYVAAIHESGTHLLSIINDILDLSKLEAGKTELEETEVDLVNLVDQTVLYVRESALNRGIEVVINDLGDLPEVRVDHRMIKQVLINLLSNAVKFTNPGGKIEIDAMMLGNGSLAIAVTDNGIGMAPEDIPKALSSFGQLDGGLARQHEGTGLGLPLARSLIELHGGELKIHSELDVGTTMTACIPDNRILTVN